jgi:hypothetical protein
VYPSRLVHRHPRPDDAYAARLAGRLALVAVGAALLLVGFVLALQLGGTSTAPIQSQEPAVTSPSRP